MTRVNQLLILSRNAERYAALIRKQALPDLHILACSRPAEAQADVARCNIILGEPALVAEVVDRARRLQWVQSTFAGVEALVGGRVHKNYQLTNVKNLFGPLMSEYVVGYLLALERHFFETYENQKRRLWQNQRYRNLRNLVVGICGVGSIGRHIARTAKCFGMTVWGLRRSPKSVPEVDRLFTGSDFYAFLSEPDYVVVCLPLTPQTFHLFDAAAMRAMKDTAVLINVARGAVVSETALVEALRSGDLRGAVLDVFEQEPLSCASPLWRMPNIWITPHNSGYSFAESIVSIFVDNYHRFRSGRALQYPVDFARGY